MSQPRILITGGGKGSWTIRGVQLGAALGARVLAAPTEADFDWASIVVLVKRAHPGHAQAARRRGLPVVWDALDFWKQPQDNDATPERAQRLLKAQLAVLQPVLTLGATEAMADAIGRESPEVVGGRCLPHHAWAGSVPTPARPEVRTVGYEGNPLYLGRWAEWVTIECRARGWHFAVNSEASTPDIVVAFRDGPFDGWICREWKSGVKAGNAIAAGRPFISQDSAAVRELQPAGSVVETPSQLRAAFDEWAGIQARQAVVDDALRRAPTFTVDAVARRYAHLLAACGASAKGTL